MSKRINRISASLLAAAFLLSACFPAPTLQPTSAPPTLPPTEAAPTAAPTEVPTVEPTPTPQLAPSPTPAPTAPLPDEVVAGETLRNEGAGFTFTSVQGYEAKTGTGQASVAYGSGDILISMGVRPLEKDETPAQALEKFFESVKQDVSDLETGPVEPVEVGGQKGVEASLSGTFPPGKVEGEALAVPSGFGSVFITLGFGRTEDTDLWAEQGSQVFAAVLDSVEFFEPVITSACLIAPDPTYGLTEDNPIAVGGDITQGRQREDAFLANLRGPGGEDVKAFRLITYNANGKILDVYLMNYEGLSEPVKLFLTVYEYADPTAPQGFICYAPVPFGPPEQGI